MPKALRCPDSLSGGASHWAASFLQLYAGSGVQTEEMMSAGLLLENHHGGFVGMFGPGVGLVTMVCRYYRGAWQRRIREKWANGLLSYRRQLPCQLDLVHPLWLKELDIGI